MTLPCAPMKDNPELDALVEQAVAAFNAMTPEQQRAHRAAQRKSWVVGEMMLSNPHLTREYVESIYDQVAAG